MVNSLLLSSTVAEFVAQIDELYGLYLDAAIGFENNVEMIRRGQAASPASSDASAFFIGDGAPISPTNVLLHRTTQGEFKDRNRRDGRNYLIMARLFVVLVYHFWEIEYRPRIAKAAGLADPNELKIPILGDLRLLRHEIIHHKGQLSPDERGRLEVLANLLPGEMVDLPKPAMSQVVSELKAAMDSLVTTWTGEDPGHRAVLHVV